MRRAILVLFAALPLLGAGGTTVRPQNVLLSRFRTEPVVAVDPADPLLVVAGANTNYVRQPDGTFPAAYFNSHDGGRSFGVGTAPLLSPYTTGADPSVAIARDGTVFYSYLGESPTYCAGGPGAVLLAHSIDRGVSFRGPVVVDSSSMDDRPTLAVESVPTGPSHVFLAWTRSYQDHSEVWFARSVDGGATFSPAAQLYSSPLDNFGAQPVVGPQGHVYVVWLSHRDLAPTAAGSGQVLLAASADGGAHFGPVRGAGRSFVNLPALAQPGSLRDITAATAAAAPSGALYVAYTAIADQRPDGTVDADIWLIRSLDDGTTWSQPERVNDVRHGDRFMPALSVMDDGTVGVAFYDRRTGPGDLDVYAARASFVRGFKATENVRVNSAPSPIASIAYFKGGSAGDSCFPSGRFFGDYIGTAADGSALGVVWADGQLHQKDETDLWFARVPLPAFPGPRRHVLAVRSPPARGWARLVALPRRLLRWMRGAGHAPLGGLLDRHLLLIGVLFLLPALAVATAFRSLVGSDRWP